MEDPVSARELSKQSGAFQGKPELGNEVDKTHCSNPGEADRIHPPRPQDDVTENLPGDGVSIGLAQAEPAELE